MVLGYVPNFAGKKRAVRRSNLPGGELLGTRFAKEKHITPM
jgi:hypothetical protein